MPINLNNVDLDSLVEMIDQLRPGRAIMSTDGEIVRREANNVGFACGVGLGGYGTRRANHAEEAAEYMLQASAKRMHPQALGGGTSYEDYEEAWNGIRKERTEADGGPSPANKPMRSVASRASLPSYKVRAQKARDALRAGDVGGALRHLQAIREHASRNERSEDVLRAEKAIAAIREHHSEDPAHPSVPKLKHTTVELKVVGGQHHVFKNGNDIAGPMSRQDAEARRDFLVREAARAEDLHDIDDEIAGRATLVARHEEEAA